MTHQSVHSDHDECAHSHSHDCHGESQPSQPHHDDENHDDTPHSHKCCHATNADRSANGVVSIGDPHGLLIEILFEKSLAPDSPVLSEDKPPLI